MDRYLIIVRRALKTAFIQYAIVLGSWIFVWGFAWEADLDGGSTMLGVAMLIGLCWGQAHVIGNSGSYPAPRTGRYIVETGFIQAAFFVLIDLAWILLFKAVTDASTQDEYMVDKLSLLPTWFGLAVGANIVTMFIQKAPPTSFNEVSPPWETQSSSGGVPGGSNEVDPALEALAQLAVLLRSGASVNDLHLSLVSSGMDPDTTHDMIMALCQDDPWSCTTCGEQFHPEVMVCSHCETPR